MRARTVEGAALSFAIVLALTACGDSGSTDDMPGAELFVEIGCQACHGETDTDLAPTLRSIWGTEVELEDGSSVIVDEVYVKRSMIDPGANVVAGFDARMPTFGLSDSEVDRLVEYVRSLG
jgi:cytochrome c oxidase subunit 2